MKEARALSVKEEKSFSLACFLNYSSFLEGSQKKSDFPFLTSPLTQANGNGNGRIVGIKVGSDVSVNNEKANGKVLTIRDWEEMWEYVVSSRFVRDEIRKRHGYITGISVEDLVRDAYVVGMEELKRCRESNFCNGCESVECVVWEKRFQVSLRRALRKLQDLGKKNGKVSYLELVEEDNGEERLPTTYRKDWDLSANFALDPLTLLCAKEEERERVDEEDERIKKVRKVLNKLKKKEREVWELLLEGLSPHEVAKRLGYRRVQGVYMVIRRTTRKLRKFLRSEEVCNSC